MPGQGRRLRREERREQLLDVAVELAAGGDLGAVSVEEVAAAAGVSEGLLYHYFPTKEALLVAAVERAADAMVAALDVAIAGASLTALTDGLTAYLDHVQADPTGWRAVLQARTGPLAAVGDRVEQHSRRLALRGLGVDEPSPALVAALEGWSALERAVCLSWVEQPGLARETVEDLLLSSFLGALSAASRHDAQSLEVLHRLSAPPDQDPPG